MASTIEYDGSNFGWGMYFATEIPKQTRQHPVRLQDFMSTPNME